MKKKFVSSAILAAALAVTSVVPAFAEGDTSEVYWYSDVAGYGPANWNTDSSPALDYVRDNIGLTFNLEQPPTDAATKLGLMLATNDQSVPACDLLDNPLAAMNLDHTLLETPACPIQLLP